MRTPLALLSLSVLFATAQAAAQQRPDIPERARYAEVLRTHGMRVALGRAGRLEEFAAVAAFLLSPRASYLTGALLNVDGGTDF